MLTDISMAENMGVKVDEDISSHALKRRAARVSPEASIKSWSLKRSGIIS